jgi:hypothetical protein
VPAAQTARSSGEMGARGRAQYPPPES